MQTRQIPTYLKPTFSLQSGRHGKTCSLQVKENDQMELIQDSKVLDTTLLLQNLQLNFKSGTVPITI